MPYPEVAGLTAAAVYRVGDASPEEAFAEAFIKLGGKFIFCEKRQDMVDALHLLYDDAGWQQLLCADPVLLEYLHEQGMSFIQPADASAEGADACITGCEQLVARTGSVLLSSKQPMGRVAPVYYPVHIIVAYRSQVVGDIDEGLSVLLARYGSDMPSMINLNTGPSRTADIEKTLVVGVHGPKEVYCFLIMD